MDSYYILADQLAQLNDSLARIADALEKNKEVENE